MSKSRVIEQIRQIDLIADSYPELDSNLKLQKAILETLRPIDDLDNRGASNHLDWSIFNLLVEKSLIEKNSLRNYIDPALFDIEVFQNTFMRTLEVLQSFHQLNEGLALLSEPTITNKLDFSEAIKALIDEDASWFKEKGLEIGIDPPLLVSILELPLRPFFEELARRFENSYIEEWWEPHCPICGRTPPVGRMKSKKLYLVCSYCGDTYLADLFQCINCGNKDPSKLGFVSPESNPELEIQFCEACKMYIKVINEDRLTRRVPIGLEDLLTRSLDSLAQLPELGLTR